MRSLEGLALIAIGKNEGERLLESFASFPAGLKILYVDSASSDKSVELVENNFPNIKILKLEKSDALCAAYARNAGAKEALRLWPELEFLQFLDADCKLAPSWLQAGLDFLMENVTLSAVCGYRTEEHPEQSVFNLLCDLEWDRSLGKIPASGGDFLIRRKAFFLVQGFREFFTAGEEADFFSRLESAGGSIHRISVNMSTHDAKILKPLTWVKRSLRSGVALALGSRFYPTPIRRSMRLQTLKVLFWAFLLPVAIAVGGNAILLASALYALNLMSSLKYELSIKKLPFARASLYAVFTLLAKWPQAIGIFLGSFSHSHKSYASYR